MRPNCILSVLALSLALSACTSGPETRTGGARDEPVAQAPAKPWTTTFQTPALLVAREVTIEGPKGLREHVALTVDSNVHDYSVETVPEGLLQVLSVKPEDEGGAVVRCVLDSLQIAAESRVRVLERPGDVPVVVLATGNAVYRRTDGSAEQQGESLRLVGQESR